MFSERLFRRLKNAVGGLVSVDLNKQRFLKLFTKIICTRPESFYLCNPKQGQTGKVLNTNTGRRDAGGKNKRFKTGNIGSNAQKI